MNDNERAMLRRLLDIEEIKQLEARYFRTLDRKEWHERGQVFPGTRSSRCPRATSASAGATPSSPR
jgi:SnoaL-like protein